jgi:hypothetical protein
MPQTGDLEGAGGVLDKGNEADTTVTCELGVRKNATQCNHCLGTIDMAVLSFEMSLILQIILDDAVYTKVLVVPGMYDAMMPIMTHACALFRGYGCPVKAWF